MNPFHHPPEETARQQVRQAMEQRRAAEATAGVIAAQYDLMQHVAKRQRGEPQPAPMPELTHECAVCRKRFSSAAVLTTHSRVLHPNSVVAALAQSSADADPAAADDGDVRCPVCRKGFRSQAACDDHQAAAHETCTICRQPFATRHQLDAHMSVVHPHAVHGEALPFREHNPLGCRRRSRAVPPTLKGRR